MTKYTLWITRTESAEMDVEADSPEAACMVAKEKINTAQCIADLDLDWQQDGGIRIENLSQ